MYQMHYLGLGVYVVNGIVCRLGMHMDFKALLI